MKPKYDVEELEKVVGYNEETDEIPQEEVKFAIDDKQCRISVPKDFVKLLKLDSEKDKFIFVLHPPKSKGEDRDLTGYLKRG